jgi:hypothetical protein
VLNTKLVAHGTDHVTQVLVCWSALPDSLATWEDQDVLQQKFPDAANWGQVVIQGRGNVNSTHSTKLAKDGP